MNKNPLTAYARPTSSRVSQAALACIYILFCACGGEPDSEPEPEPEPAVVTDPGVEANEANEASAQRQFDVDVDLVGPPRVITGHPQVMPPWGDALRDLIDPEQDKSWSEKLAIRFEVDCQALLHGVLESNEEVVQGYMADESGAFLGLFPEFGEARYDDGSFAVYDHVHGDDLEEDLQGLLERVQLTTWSKLESREVIVSMVGIQSAGDGQWLCDLEIRIVGSVDDVPTMIDIRADAMINEGESGSDSPQLLSMRAKKSRMIRRAKTTFKSISGLILEDLPYWERELGLGCGDYDRIYDRRSIAFGTGMLGMALGDVDGNGLDDLYISTISGFPNRLLLHQPDGSVIDGAAAAGVDILDTTRGCLMVDLDGDDDLDLCITRQGDLVIYWNDGTGKFSDPRLLDGPGDSPIYSICSADADLDGDLDLFCCRYRLGRGAEIVPTPFHDAANGVANLYWRNDGDRSFTSAGEETGLVSSDTRYSFIGLWEDFNDDNLIDLYVINDFGPNNLYINTGSGFEDRAAEMGILDASTGMGISGADIDLDGDLDFYVTNIFSAPGLRAINEPDYRGGDEATRELHRALADGMSLYVQDTPGKFVEAAASAGVDHGGWAWGAIFYDWNLDGYPDIYVPNGFISYENETDVESFFWRWVVAKTPTSPGIDETYNRNWEAISGFNRMEGFAYHGHERNHLYLNLGDGTFADVSAISDVDFIDDGRVAARTDWDNDGLEDLVLVSGTGPRLRIVRNAHPDPGHRVVIELHGELGSADAVSSRIRVHRSDGKVVSNTVYAGEGLLGQSSYRRFFGLGDCDGAVDVEVRWPDGETQRFEGLAVDRGWKLYREGGKAVEWEFESSPFAGKPHSPARRTQRAVNRAVLADKLPMRYYGLQDSEGRSITLDGLPEMTKILTLWDPETRSGVEFLRQLAESQLQILEAGAIVCPVAVEGGAGDGAEILRALGLGEFALNASANDELVLEALLVEVLNTYSDITLPLSLLLDADSNLCALYYGSIPTPELLEDLNRMSRIGKGGHTIALSDGHWLSQPKRRYRQIIRALMMLGARDLATDLKQKKN